MSLMFFCLLWAFLFAGDHNDDAGGPELGGDEIHEIGDDPEIRQD